MYALGERVDKAPSVRPLSIGSMLAKFVHIASYLSPFFPTVVDLHTDARSLSCDKSSFSNFVNHMWHSDWAEGRDAAPYDVTFEASDEREARMEGAVNPGTFYRSYTACMVCIFRSTSYPTIVLELLFSIDKKEIQGQRPSCTDGDEYVLRASIRFIC